MKNKRIYNFPANYVELIKGNDDGKTFDYIIDVISGVNVNSYSDTAFYNRYSGYKTERSY